MVIPTPVPRLEGVADQVRKDFADEIVGEDHCIRSLTGNMGIRMVTADSPDHGSR
jgi:hypothetical protein